jgi:hypothetical protein
MMLPSPGFAEVLPPADGLRLAFAAARRRRRRKAAVGMGVGAVVLATALAISPPTGRSVLQQPVQPAGSTHTPALPGIEVPFPHRVAPTPAGEAAPSTKKARGFTLDRVAVVPVQHHGPASSGCGLARRDHLLCAGFRANTTGRTTVNVRVCAPRSAAVVVSRSSSQDVQVAAGSCVLPVGP